MQPNRRDFITLLGGAAAWPLTASARSSARMRRIGTLIIGEENDPAARAGLAAFKTGLQELGWQEGGNVRIHNRWLGVDLDRMPDVAFLAKHSV